MKWVLRFLGFATLFAIPAHFLSGPWQRALGGTAAAILAAFGIHIELQEVQVMAPLDIGIYLALCLASRRGPALARRRAIEWGLIIMAGLEIVTVVVAILIYFALSHRGATPDSGLRVMEYLIEFVPWVSAVTVWLLFLGAWEIPFDSLVPRAAGARDSRAGRR